MSSHHIIRDEQEPALILADLESFPFDLLGQLLEWAPYTICGPQALNQVLKYEINVDEVYSHDPEVKLKTAHFPGIQMHEDEVNWLENTIYQLTKRGHAAVNIVTGEAFNRFDWMHKMSQMLLVDVITPTYKYIRVEQKINKWMPMASQITLIGENSSFEVTGGILTSDKITVPHDGMVSIKATSPFILGLSN